MPAHVGGGAQFGASSLMMPPGASLGANHHAVAAQLSLFLGALGGANGGPFDAHGFGGGFQ
jgi:hypothetical protein